MSDSLPVHPTQEALISTLRGLIGRKVAATPSKPLIIGGTLPVVVGVFRDDQGEVAGAIILDIPLAAYLGASLVMIPAGVAQESVKARKLSSNLAENLQEVLNICTQLFVVQGGPHVRFDVLAAPPPSPGKDVTGRALKPNGRVDAELEIEGYGKGKLSLVW